MFSWITGRLTKSSKRHDSSLDTCRQNKMTPFRFRKLYLDKKRTASSVYTWHATRQRKLCDISERETDGIKFFKYIWLFGFKMSSKHHQSGFGRRELWLVLDWADLIILNLVQCIMSFLQGRPKKWYLPYRILILMFVLICFSLFWFKLTPFSHHVYSNLPHLLHVYCVVKFHKLKK